VEWPTYKATVEMLRGEVAAVGAGLDGDEIDLELLFQGECDWSCLAKICKRGYALLLDTCISKCDEVPINEHCGSSALQIAVRKRNMPVARRLLEAGAVVDAAPFYQWTPLVMAADLGHVEMVKLLLDHGAAVDGHTGVGWSALTTASTNGQMEMVTMLLAQGANVNRVHGNGRTDLMYTADRGHANVVSELLKRGAVADVMDGDGETALIWAAKEGHDDVVSELLRYGASTEVVNEDGETALVIAACRGHPATVSALLSGGADVEGGEATVSPLKEAVDCGHLAAVKLLLEAGADVGKVQMQEPTPLDHALKYEDGKYEERQEIFRLLSGGT
jgi:ankyrin repeat protein